MASREPVAEKASDASAHNSEWARRAGGGIVLAALGIAAISVGSTIARETFSEQLEVAKQVAVCSYRPLFEGTEPLSPEDCTQIEGPGSVSLAVRYSGSALLIGGGIVAGFVGLRRATT